MLGTKTAAVACVRLHFYSLKDRAPTRYNHFDALGDILNKRQRQRPGKYSIRHLDMHRRHG